MKFLYRRTDKFKTQNKNANRSNRSFKIPSEPFVYLT